MNQFLQDNLSNNASQAQEKYDKLCRFKLTFVNVIHVTVQKKYDTPYLLLSFLMIRKFF